MLSGASGVEPPPLNLMGLMGCSLVVDDGPGCVGNCVSGKVVSSIDDATEMMWLSTSPHATFGFILRLHYLTSGYSYCITMTVPWSFNYKEQTF